MNNRTQGNSYGSTPLPKLSIIVWVSMIILTGTYLRTRSAYATEIDWLVITRILLFSIGGVLGICLIKKSNSWSSATRALLLYVFVAGVSGIFSPSHKLVLGYWILLAGASLLTIGLVTKCNISSSLEKLETIWLYTICGILLKDIVIIAIFRTPIEDVESVRLGISISSPAYLGLYAIIGFWLSSGQRGKIPLIIIGLMKCLFLYIIVASRTRIVLIAFIVTIAMRIGLSGRKNSGRWVLAFSLCTLVLGASLANEMGIQMEVMQNAISWFNRGQRFDVVRTLTGRTEIWTSAIEMVFSDPVKALFGHGYGVTRFYLNWRAGSPPFFASHCHNAYIEHLFAMGLLGAMSFIYLVILNMNWLSRFRNMYRVPAEHLAFRAASTVVTIFILFLTEIPLGGRINPAGILYIFYLIVLYRIPYGKESEMHLLEKRHSL